MSDAKQTIVGIIGLGSMGLGMAQTLAGKGFRTLGFDLSEERKELAQQSGVVAVDTIAHAFEESTFLVFSLPTAKDVASVVNDQIEILKSRSAQRVIIIDTSTSEPDVSRELAAKLALLGHGFLDAPVSGGPAGAASGKLTMMIGGTDEDVALARPAIEAMSAKALHVGPSGAGNVAKLVNNLLAAAHMVTTSEGLKLARRRDRSRSSATGSQRSVGSIYDQRSAFPNVDHVGQVRQRFLDGTDAKGRSACA